MYLTAKSEDERSAWVDAIRGAITPGPWPRFEGTLVKRVRIASTPSRGCALDSLGQHPLASAGALDMASPQGHRFKTWRERYFVLIGEKLFYFEDEAGSKAGEMELRGCTVGPAPGHGRENCIQAAKRSHYIILCVAPCCGT